MGKGDVADRVNAEGQSALDADLTAPAPRKKPPQKQPPQKQQLRRFNMADIEPESVTWLWPGRIAQGKFTLIDGDPGEGKSLITIDLAARLSTGRPMPGESAAPQGPQKTLFLCCEDDLADTIAPRLDAAEAERKHVEVIRELIKIPGQLALLESAIVEMGAKLVFIDPLNGYIDGKVNTHSDHAVRCALTPLVELAARLRVPIVGVRHLNKQAGASAKYRGNGSIAYVGLARSALMVGPDPENEDLRILASSKGNLSKRAPSLRFAIVAEEGQPGRIDWRGESSVTADELCALPEPEHTHSARRDAADFLLEALADGSEVPVKELYGRAKEQGIAERTLRRARRDLGVEAGGTPKAPTWRLRTVAAPGNPLAAAGA